MISTSPHQYRTLAEQLGVSSDLVERAISQARMSERNDLPPILTLKHLAHQTGTQYQYLREIVSRKHDPYLGYVIRKRRGGARHIAAPEPELLAVQRWMVASILNKRPTHPSSMAYAPGSSPYKCAKAHLGARWLIKLDIHDFFESISERRAYFVFRDCGYQPLVSFELARICTRVRKNHVQPPEWASRDGGTISSYAETWMGHLPQGAPTSPMLSNLVSMPLDALLEAVALKNGLTYTRYSDDITLSAGHDIDHQDAWTFVVIAARILHAFGHRVHRKKITIAPPGARRLVLGLLVDGERVRLTNDYKNRLEAHVRGIRKFGLAKHAAQRHFTSIWGMVRHIGGLLSHAHAVEPSYASALKTSFEDALRSQSWKEPD